MENILQTQTKEEINRIKRLEASKRCQKRKYAENEDYRRSKIEQVLNRYHATKQLKGTQSTNEYYLANREKIKAKALERYYTKKAESNQQTL